MPLYRLLRQAVWQTRHIPVVLGLMDNADDDSDADDMREDNNQHGLQRPLHARQRPSGPCL